MRREKVLELLSRGLDQTTIAFELKVSQPTVSLDISQLKKQANEYVKNHSQHLALEYRKVMQNYEILRREAWEHFKKRMKDDHDNDEVRLALYDVLQSINDGILNTLSIGDVIESEILKKSEDEQQKIREQKNQAVDQPPKQQEQAIF